MTKRQIIDEIMVFNRSAEPEFLSRFSDEELSEYLEHLRVLRIPRLQGDPRRYDRYFQNCPPQRSRPAGSPEIRSDNVGGEGNLPATASAG
jgi:hypothetical protein